MTQYHLDVRKTVVEVDDQPEHRILLGCRSGVGYAAIGIQSALIADADGVGVGSTGMRTHSLYRTALMYLAVARNIIMIADVKPAVHFHMVVAQLLFLEAENPNITVDVIADSVATASQMAAGSAPSPILTCPLPS